MVEKRQKETMPQRVVEDVNLKLQLLQRIVVEERQETQNLANKKVRISDFFYKFQSSGKSISKLLISFVFGCLNDIFFKIKKVCESAFEYLSL